MHITYLADLVDPTDDGILSSLANWVLGALMVLVVIAGGWHGFSAWNDAKGKGGPGILRDHAIGILSIEAFLGGILLFANRGTSIIPSFM